MASSWFSVTSQAASVYAVSQTSSKIPFSAKPMLRFLSKPSRSSYPVVKAQSNNISGSSLEEISKSLDRDHEVVAMVGLNAMKKSNASLEDFFRSYFMFHQLDVNKPQLIFRYLPVLSFTESYVYQMDALNEKIVSESASGSKVISSSHGWTAESRVSFETVPFKPLEDLLEREGLLTQRIQQEFRSGEEYWALERQLCSALSNKNKISLEDVMRANHLRSFDYRALNLLLYKLRGEEVNELHMEFLSISTFVVEIADDLLDYGDDVLGNSFNMLRMFVGIYGPTNAPTELAKLKSEAEDKYKEIMKSLDPHLSSNYQRRCEEAIKEGGENAGRPLGAWDMPAVISDEEAYRAAAQR